MGIVMPHVDTVEEAKAMVDAFRFAPQGHRSIAGNYAQLGFAAKSAADVVDMFNKAILVVAMMETPRAIENAEKIAAVEGDRRAADGHQRFVPRNGYPGKNRRSTRRRRHRQHGRSLQKAREMGRAGRRLHQRNF